MERIRSRIFTLDEANQLLPSLDAALHRLASLRRAVPVRPGRRLAPRVHHPRPGPGAGRLLHDEQGPDRLPLLEARGAQDRALASARRRLLGPPSHRRTALTGRRMPRPLTITNPEISEYLRSIQTRRHPVLRPMEAYAEKHGFPIIGPLVG